jgi:hypothetical protein
MKILWAVMSVWVQVPEAVPIVEGKRLTKTNKPRKRLEVTAISILAEDEAVWVTIEIKALSREESDIIR